MATRVSVATGNFTTAGTWGAVSAVASAEVDSEASTRNISTGNTDSAAFTLAATAVQMVGIKISSIITPTGTFSVSLRNSTSPGSRDFTVTVNASDLHSSANGWYFFKPGATVTPNGTDSYIIRLTRSVADSGSNRISVYASSASDANIARAVVMTTTGAPAANEKIIVAGNLTGAATSNSITVTNDNTATTSFGPTVSGGPPQGMTINDKSTFAYGTAASTAYYLKLKGILQVNPGGTFTIGTIPSTSSAVLEFDSVANVDSGLVLSTGTTTTFTGNTVTATSTLLTADVAAAGTVLTLASTAGWSNGDVLFVCSTTRTSGDGQQRTVSTVDSATQVTLTAGVTVAHSGTAPTQGEVLNLTRNVKIRGISATLQGFVRVNNGASFTVRYAEFSLMGSATSNKRGVDCNISSSGTFDVQYSSLHDFTVASSTALNITGAVAGGTVTYSNNVEASNALNDLLANSGYTFSGNVINSALSITAAGTITNNTIVGNVVTLNVTTGTFTFSGNTIHSSAGVGLTISGTFSGMTLTNTTIWRCTSQGINCSNPTNSIRSFTIDTLTIFGCSGQNIRFTSLTSQPGELLLLNVTSNGDSTFSTTTGLEVSGSTFTGGIYLVNCSFGVASGIKTAHTRDIDFGTAGTSSVRIFGDYTKLASATGLNWDISNGRPLGSSGCVAQFSGWNQAANTHRSYFDYGQIDTDTSVFHDASPSQKLTPNNASSKLNSGVMRAAVNSGSTLTVGVYVRKSSSGAGDSADYNGNQPRLVLKRNYQAGITADTVLDTMSVAIGNWEQLTATTAAVTDHGVLEFYVDCDGTAGFINVDDWSIT